MLSEEEAKKKWCPHAKTLGTLKQSAQPGSPHYTVAAGGQNRGFAMDGPLPHCRCLASQCMAWRWSGVRVEEKLIPTKDYDAKNQAKADGWRYEVTYDDGMCLFVRAKSDAPEVGYCGLAGAPQ